jgi:hypothetical protein
MMIKSRFLGSSNSSSSGGESRSRRRGAGGVLSALSLTGQQSPVVAAVWLAVLSATAVLICRTTAFHDRTPTIASSHSSLAFVVRHSAQQRFVTRQQELQLHRKMDAFGSLPAAENAFASPYSITPGNRLTTTIGLYASVLSNNNIEKNARKKQKAASLFQLYAASGQQPGDGEDDDEDVDDNDTASGSGRTRKRDRLRDWLSSKSPMSPMVQMQRVGGRSENDRDDDNDDKNDEDDDEEPVAMRQPPQRRVKARLESLFSGMPSMNEILYGPTKGNDEDENTFSRRDDESSTGTSRFSRGTRSSSGNDAGWFQDDRQAIIDEYENMLKDMLQKIEEQRRVDPESVPENAPAMIKSVLRQGMCRCTCFCFVSCFGVCFKMLAPNTRISFYFSL